MRTWYFFFIFFFFIGLKDVQGSLLGGSGDLMWLVLGIKPRLAVCKANDFLAIVSLWPTSGILICAEGKELDIWVFLELGVCVLWPPDN